MYIGLRLKYRVQETFNTKVKRLERESPNAVQTMLMEITYSRGEIEMFWKQATPLQSLNTTVNLNILTILLERCLF